MKFTKWSGFSDITYWRKHFCNKIGTPHTIEMDGYIIFQLFILYMVALIESVYSFPKTSLPVRTADGTYNNHGNKNIYERDQLHKNETYSSENKPDNIHDALDIAPAKDEMLQMSPSHQLGCIHGNMTYKAGEKFRPSPCMFCRCPRHGGRTRCMIVDCLQVSGRYARSMMRS